MGLELARAFIRIRGDSTELSGDLEDTKDKVKEALGDITSGIFSTLASFAMFGRGVIRRGLQAAGEFEKTTVEMETLLGSAEETSKLLAKLTKFAVETPFEMPGILQVTQGLIQFGERGDELMSTLKILGDASGGTSQKFQLLGMVFNQVRGVGKLLTQDFRQLSTRGIISLQDIAKHYKVTTTVAEQMLSSGKVKFEDFRKIMKGLTEEGGRFANAMIKQSTTLLGLNSTLSDARNIATRILVMPLVPAVKALTQVFIALAGSVEAVVRIGGSAVSFAFVGATAVAMLGGAVSGLIVVLNLLGLTIRKVIIGTGIGAVIILIGAAIGFLIGMIKDCVVVQKAFNAVWDGLIEAARPAYDVLMKFWKDNEANLLYIKSLWSEVVRNIMSLLTDFGDKASSIFEMFISLVGRAGELFAQRFIVMASVALRFISLFLEGLAILVTDWTMTWDMMKLIVALAALQITSSMVYAYDSIVAVVIASSFAMVQIMKDTAYNLVLPFVAATEAIKGLFIALWEGIKTKFAGGDFTDAFFAKLNEEMAKVDTKLRPIGEKAAKAYKAAYKPPGDPYKDLIDTTKKNIQELWDKMKGARNTKLTADQMIADPAAPGGPAAGVPEATKAMLNTGRYSFSDFGNKIQDSLLGTKDHGAQQVELMKLGNDKQDELIKAVKDAPKSGLE